MANDSYQVLELDPLDGDTGDPRGSLSLQTFGGRIRERLRDRARSEARRETDERKVVPLFPPSRAPPRR